MNAVAYAGKGRFELLEKPVPEPRAGEVLIAGRRVGICGTDLSIFQGRMQHRVEPGRILGHETIAIVRTASRDGTFSPGDRVVVEPTIFCGDCAPCRRGRSNVCQKLRVLGIDQDGAFQQFWNVPEGRLHRVPDRVSDDHAAMVEPLAVAVHSVRLSALRRGETVAIIGGGNIGLLVALLARRAGAGVVVFEINPFRLKFAHQLQFKTFNPAEHDSAEVLADFTQGAGADVVFETSGTADGAGVMTSLAAVHGRVMVVGIQEKKISMDLFRVFLRELSFQGARAYARCDFEEAIQLIATGQIDVAPFISRHYPLENLQEAVKAALFGEPVMKILIDIS